MPSNDTIQAGTRRTPISFNRLGPFYRLQLKLGLLTETDLAAGRRAILFMALAWLPGAVLAAIEILVSDTRLDGTILLDFSIYAFGIAIGAFVLMEQTSDRRMAALIGQFSVRRIVPERAREGVARARANMERRTGAALAEAVILVLAYVLSYMWLHKAISSNAGGMWAGRMVGDSLHLSPPGWWAMLVAQPLYWFLLGRWLWRFVTWGMLLRDFSRCELELVATHPDRCGGLAFLGEYPRTYVLFVFAISTVIAATVLKLVVHGGASLMSFKFAMAGMIVFFVVAFLLPLLVFTPRLVVLKRRGLSHYGALASHHNLAFEAKWIDATQGAGQEEILGSPDVSSLADLSAGYDLVKRMLPAPITKASVLPILAAALLPMACVAATQVPFAKIFAGVKGLLLL